MRKGYLALLAALCVAAAQPAVRHTHIVIVLDGLRPDYVTPEVMPRLFRLAKRGVMFTAHHSVFPTVTRVNASSFVPGAYPDAPGLLGNTIYVPSANPARALDTGERENLELVQRADGRLLTAPTLGEILQQHGRKLLAVSSGSTGSAYLLNYAAADGAIVHTDFTKPSVLADEVLATLGQPPGQTTPNDAQNERAIDAYLKLAIEHWHPDVTFMWITDPDHTAHANGIGAELTKKSLSLVDAGVGRIEDTLAAKGLLDRVNIIVTSDHGFSTQTGEFDLDAIVQPFARRLADGASDIIVAEGAIYLRGGPDPKRLKAIVAALQQRREVGAIFTRARAQGSNEGEVAGTLSFDAIRWNHARSGDILVSANWTDRVNPQGFKGTTTQEGVAGHGTSSPFDIHNTLIAVGPDFREHATSDLPTANVDIAPTLLHLLGLPIGEAMAGRVIDEGLRDEHPVARVTRTTVTVSTPDAKYVLTAHYSSLSRYRYFDFADVRRH